MMHFWCRNLCCILLNCLQPDRPKILDTFIVKMYFFFFFVLIYSKNVEDRFCRESLAYVTALILYLYKRIERNSGLSELKRHVDRKSI